MELKRLFRVMDYILSSALGKLSIVAQTAAFVMVTVLVPPAFVVEAGPVKTVLSFTAGMSITALEEDNVWGQICASVREDMREELVLTPTAQNFIAVQRVLEVIQHVVGVTAWKNVCRELQKDLIHITVLTGFTIIVILSGPAVVALTQFRELTVPTDSVI